jgi:ketosteroid isomerase-like protein
MSQENVEIVRKTIQFWNEGDFESIRPFFDPAVVFDRTRSMGTMTGVYEGIEDAERLLLEWSGSWQEYHSRIDEYIDVGDDVVVVGVFKGRGRASGATVEATITQVYTVRDGKIVRHVLFQNRADALEAVGLGGV